MRWVAALLAAALALSAGHVARSQGFATVVPSCGSQNYPTTTVQQQPLTMDATGKLCTAGAFSGTFNSSATATSTLPTLSAGSVTPQASLAGAQYVQPVFGSASGGGTQVDATHGLPVNIIAGSSSGAITDASAFTQGTTSVVPAGGLYTTSVSNLASGQAGIPRLTIDRIMMHDLEKIGGTNAVTGGASGLLAVGGSVASGGSNANNPLKVGGPFNTTQPTVSSGQMVDAQYTTRGAAIVATGVDVLNVTVSQPIAAGSNTIGAVTQASGPWTTNVTQLNSTTIATGSGATTAGTQRFILATDQPNLTTPFNVASTTLALDASVTAAQVAVGGATAPAKGDVVAGVFNTVLPALSNGQAAALQFDNSSELIISPTNLSVAQASTTSGQTGSLVMGAVTTSAPTYTTAKTNPLSLDTSGNLRINCTTGCSSSSFADNSAFTQGTSNIQTIGGEYVSGGAGNLTSGNAGAVQLTIDRMMYVNVGKVGGTATDTNTGNASAGTQRVALATNSPAIAAWGLGATGSAPPSGAHYLGANTGGATGGLMQGLITCNNHVFKHITTATDTLAVQGVASQKVYICGWRSRAAGTATWYLENTASANANCVSTLTQLTGVATEAVNTGEERASPFWDGLANTAGNGLCINSTGTGGVDVDVWYAQF